ncbi:hypothetical protein [Kitasatospora sp. NPDC057198]|uniref:hypothetical protein n=1 Tax=Kitasatospora sp. NPDC057198 TaxID=3346046 RepID=UPI00363AE4B5
MRTNRLLAATVLSVLGVAGLTACDSDGGGKNDAAPAASTPAAATVPASASASVSVSVSPSGAGGGLEGLTAAEIEKKSQAAGRKLTSVKFTADLKIPEGRMKAVFSSDDSGNCVGTMAIAGKGSAEFRRIADKVWLKPDAEFIDKVVDSGRKDDYTAVVGDKWLATGKGEDIGGFAQFCDTALELQRGKAFEGAGTVSGPEQLDGVKAVLVRRPGEEYAFADEGEPHLLSAKSDSQGDMRFSDFDVPVKVVAPPAGQVIDFGAARDS